jgi:hypothetical protein
MDNYSKNMGAYPVLAMAAVCALAYSVGKGIHYN